MKEALAASGKARKTILFALNNGALPAVPPAYPGHGWSIAPADLTAWVERGCPTRNVTHSNDETTRVAS
jgi:hypothetical protein